MSPTSQKTRTGWTLAIVSLALFMVVLDNLVVTVALPAIREDLGATLQSLEWTINAYTLAFAVMLIPGAALGDRFGRRRLFLIGLSLFTASSAAAAPPWASGLASAAPASRSARSSAAPSSTASPGTGSSGSTSPPAVSGNASASPAHSLRNLI